MDEEKRDYYKLLPTTKITEEDIKAVEINYERKRVKGVISNSHVTLKDMEVSIRLHDGNLSAAARYLSMDVLVLRSYCKKFPKLGKVLQEVRDSMLDDAESEIKKQIRLGNMSAIVFVLRIFGRERGWVEPKATLEHELGPNATKSAAGLIAAMRKGMEESVPGGVIIDIPSRKLLEDSKVDEDS